MTAPVYLLEGLRAMSLTPGLPLVLEGPEARHAATVRRTRTGERLDVCDGSGLRVRCEAKAVEKTRLELLVLDVADEGEPAPKRVLVQALAKGGRDDQAVETCTEFGVHSVVPWASDRAIVSWKGKEAKAVAKWESAARAAAKQSRRSWVPRVGAPLNTKDLASAVQEAVAGGARVFVCHEEASGTLREALQVRPETGETWIVVGPEGGISPEELDALTAAGAEPVLLGEHVLRSATAGAYALATLDAFGTE